MVRRARHDVYHVAEVSVRMSKVILTATRRRWGSCLFGDERRVFAVDNNGLMYTEKNQRLLVVTLVLKHRLVNRIFIFPTVAMADVYATAAENPVTSVYAQA